MFLALVLAAQTQALVFRNVTGIDGTGTAAQPAMTVVIRDGRIETVAPSGRVAIPRGARQVDGTGKFLIPERADLVVLRANPLADIRNTTTIDAVVVRGQLLDRVRLDSLLREAERLAASN